MSVAQKIVLRRMVVVRLMEEEEREGVLPGVGDGQVRRRG